MISFTYGQETFWKRFKRHRFLSRQASCLGIYDMSSYFDYRDNCFGFLRKKHNATRDFGRDDSRLLHRCKKEIGKFKGGIPNGRTDFC